MAEMTTSASRWSPGLQLDAGLGEGRHVVGDHRRPPGVDRLEQVAVRDEAEPLVPRVVARREVGVDVVALGQLPLDALAEQLLHQLGPTAAELEERLRGERLVPADRRARRALGEDPPHEVGDRVLGGQRRDVGGRPLQHRDVRGGLGHRRDERDRGGAAADHDDLLAGVVEVLGPGLRVHDRSGEAVHAGEVGLVALVVAVVAGAGEEEAGGELHGLSGVGALGGDVPHAVGGRPGGVGDPVVEADVLRRCPRPPRCP